MGEKLDESLDERVRDALRPLDPEGDLAKDVLARIDAQERQSGRRPRFARRERRWQIPLALAASVTIAVVVGIQWKQQQEGLRAREQLMEALEVTSSKLDLVQKIVREHSRSDGTQKNGA
jgi:negative regulator of sigma E activity